MIGEQKHFNTIDKYIMTFPAGIQAVLLEMRQLIQDAAPDAVEKMSYQMPTFWLHGNLVHFAAHQKHLGFYPTPSGVNAFTDRLSGYVTSKGGVQFPYSQPLPAALITEMVKFRVQENLQKALAGRVNRSGRKAEKRADTLKRPIHEMPGFVMEALLAADLKEVYQARPPYQKNDYIGWIMQGKREETRQKRLEQMLDELRSGDAYMGMSYNQRS